MREITRFRRCCVSYLKWGAVEDRFTNQ